MERLPELASDYAGSVRWYTGSMRRYAELSLRHPQNVMYVRKYVELAHEFAVWAKKEGWDGKVV